MTIDGFEEYLAFSAITVDKEGLNIRSLSASMNADGAESRLTNQRDNWNLSNAYMQIKLDGYESQIKKHILVCK